MRTEFFRLQLFSFDASDPPAWAGDLRFLEMVAEVGDPFLQISIEKKNRDYHCSSCKGCALLVTQSSIVVRN
jgi:hypothetical protein